jgi:hypothetical protein
MSERGKNVELDEVVWQAWLEKNRALDRLRFRRRLKVAAIVMLCLIASAMLWNSKLGGPTLTISDPPVASAFLKCPEGPLTLKRYLHEEVVCGKFVV